MHKPIDDPSQPRKEASLDPVDIEARFFRQEHRLWHLGKNWWNYGGVSKDDPRRSAVWTALTWKIVKLCVVIPMIALPAGWVGHWFAYRGNVLVEEQNNLLARQNQNEHMRQSVFEVVLLSKDWYEQLHSYADWSMSSSGSGIDTVNHEVEFGYYDNNRQFLPQFMLHVLILKKWPECSRVVEETENILSLLTDYEPSNPGKRIGCLKIYSNPDWQTTTLPQLDDYIQALTLAASEVLGPVPLADD